MTTRKPTYWQPRKPPKPKRPPCQLYRVLNPPDTVHYVYGRLTHSYEPMMRHVPIIVYGGNIVAIVDERSIIELADEPRTIVYSPRHGDVSWLRHHPYGDGNPWAKGDVG